MNVLFLTATIRDILREKGEYEALAVQNGLARAWCHPDLFFAMKSGARRGCFVFQSLIKQNAAKSASDFCPRLFWLLPFSVESPFIRPVKDFLLELQERLVPNNNVFAFSISCAESFLTRQGERGCAWALCFNGLSCGRLELYSELMFEALKSPWLILSIDLYKFSGLVKPEDFCKPRYWADSVPITTIMSLYADCEEQQTNALPPQAFCCELFKYNKALLCGTADPDFKKPVLTALNNVIAANERDNHEKPC